jgi:hypothetical protein
MIGSLGLSFLTHGNYFLHLIYVYLLACSLYVYKCLIMCIDADIRMNHCVSMDGPDFGSDGPRSRSRSDSFPACFLTVRNGAGSSSSQEPESRLSRRPCQGGEIQGLSWCQQATHVGVLGPTAHPGLPLEVLFGVGRCYRL